MFFFQAEDGIRDIGVTGVQTCALPISTAENYLRRTYRNNSNAQTRNYVGREIIFCPKCYHCYERFTGQGSSASMRKIGRASCRGKSVDLGGRRIIKKKKHIINVALATE